MRIALGTAQFGLSYGATNNKGIVSESEISKILNYARNNGIFTIDTASAYGESERNLGNADIDLYTFQVITKTPPKLQSKEVEMHFRKSLDNLKLDKIYGLMLHRAEDILSDVNGNIWGELNNLKKHNLVEKIGVSVYNEAEINQILEKYEIDLIQLPINVLDQRLLKSDILKRIKDKNIEIHARSIFLQGILLEKPNALPEYFVPFKDSLKKWHKFLEKYSLTPIEGALNFAYSLGILDYIVLGVTSLDNLQEITNAFDKVKSFPNIDYYSFASSDEALINPSLWKF